MELLKTRVVWLSIEEASAKVRSGGPLDEEGDLSLPVWAGQLPLSIVAAKPIADSSAPVTVPCPDYVENYQRRMTSAGPEGGTS
jgi:hypothetical protein